MLQCKHALMLEDIRIKANRALGTICDESAPHPHENDYTNHLSFFINIVTRLEDRAVRGRKFVAERSQSFLGRAFSCVFSHLLNRDPHFDFNVVLASCPQLFWTTWPVGW